MTARELIVVAGPSGSGKTTFRKLLASGKLRPELEALLPAGARDWPYANAHVPAHLPAARDFASLVLEYEITQCLRLGGCYRDDPALALLRDARTATIVTICSDADRIISQRRDRHGKHAQAKNPGQRLWRRLVRAPIRKLRAIGASGDVPFKSELFDRPGWLDDCYAHWSEFVEAERERRGRAAIRIAPLPEPNEAENFGPLGNEPFDSRAVNVTSRLQSS
jgi:hypothetical protein